MNPLVRTLGGLGLGVGALGAGAVAGLVSRHHALAPETGESYEPVPCVVHTIAADDGVRLHVEVSEPDDPSWRERPTIVLCHGYTLSAKSWIFVRRLLAAAGYRVVAWDQRGHGQSATGDLASYSIDQLGRDLRAVIEAQAALGELVLVGHSMGGMTIMSLARQYPELVRHRVLAVAFVATSAGGEGELRVQLGDTLGRVAQRYGAAALSPLADRPGIVAAARRGARELEDAITYRYSYASPVPRSLLKYTADIILSTPIETITAFLATLSAHDEHAGLQEFTGIETLVLNGSRDLLTPPLHSDEIVRTLPHAEHVLVHDAGHLVMLEYPDLVAEQIIALVERARRHERSEGTLVEVSRPRPRRSARAAVASTGARTASSAKDAAKDAAKALTAKGTGKARTGKAAGTARGAKARTRAGATTPRAATTRVTRGPGATTARARSAKEEM